MDEIPGKWLQRQEERNAEPTKQLKKVLLTGLPQQILAERALRAQYPILRRALLLEG